jgi:ribulose-phosphate 3-epimerase
MSFRDMSNVTPAIIPQSRRDLDTMLARAAAFADTVQIDIVDSVFAGPASWPYRDDAGLGALSGVDLRAFSAELDLMIANPEETLDAWLALHPARVVIHVESTAQLSLILSHAASRAYRLGLAFNNDTDLGLLSALDMAAVDYVQLMGIAEIGAQGKPFDERVLGRIAEVKRAYPALPVCIDGHVDGETLPRLRRAGADRFVIGSAIWGSADPAGAYRALSARAA